MSDPQLKTVTCASVRGLHRLAYTEWGPPEAPVLLCVHGLTRTGRDFDPVARRLSDRWRVICPDMAGRGRSDWLSDPQLYVPPQYVADCVTLIARLGVERVTWLGTSMGGVIGMLMAAMPGNAIERLILNDIGPEVGASGVQRIASYVGADPTFASFEEGERALRSGMAEFGPHTDEQFRILSQHYVVQREGRWTYHYDPALAVPFRTAGAPPSLWPFYDAIRVPVGVLRGETSDILSRETASRLADQGAKIVTIPGVGHAPTLIAEDQLRALESLLV